MTDWRLEESQKGRYYDRDGRPVDSFDRIIPHRPSWFAVALRTFAHADTIAAYKRVPDTHVEEDVEESVYLAKVTCTCGEEHLLELGQDRTFDCNRHFFFSGAPGRAGRRAVLVMRLPADS